MDITPDMVNVIELQKLQAEVGKLKCEIELLTREKKLLKKTSDLRIEELVEEIEGTLDCFNKLKTDVLELSEEGLYVDGGHHKQWYLHQIALLCGSDITVQELDDNGEKPIAP